ncbi:MAG: MFS transporter, partial [Janthinobacterium sp.]
WSLSRAFMYGQDRGAIGRLALAVAASADADPLALDILQRAGQELARLALALTARYGPRLPMVMGQALAACGYLALAGIGASTPYGVIVGPLLAAGVGVALTVPAMTTAVLATADRQRTGIASGALNAARQTGGVIGVGVFGSLVAGDAAHLLAGMHVALLLAGAALGIGALISFGQIKAR